MTAQVVLRFHLKCFGVSAELSFFLLAVVGPAVTAFPVDFLSNPWHSRQSHLCNVSVLDTAAPRELHRLNMIGRLGEA